MNYRKFRIIKWLLFFSILAQFSNCSGKPKGFFGFGKDPYEIRTYSTTPVFNADDRLYWVYQLKKHLSPNLYGVRLERNELGWLNLETKSLKADQEFKVLSYHYPPMKPGLYRITIYHNMEIFDQGKFRLIRE